ncbi:deaminase [Actinotalea sp. M2MS4P-6]|uniref:deoxycytidylate deaminase n=1 Tax=Actinotalea sp. M2MS4P-6 TaxID=2983762 RepID=UPI0021E5096F|nr:deaminase [Actinotalea sp. M2MS4P-6]MCV2394725.1 deaminase [Actinotalea sp. M2MS4P-6]
MSPVVHGPPRARPSWDQWGLTIATAVSTRADCTRRLVGAVMMSPDHRVLGTGYNGYPPGQPGCLTDGACPRGRLTYDEHPTGTDYVGTDTGRCEAIHAEENVVMEVAREKRAGATVYCTDEPCFNCFRVLAGSGVARVVWPDGERSFG